MGKEGQFLLFVNKDEQAGYDARHLPASQHRAGPDPTQAVGHGPSAVWTALVYALKPHSLPAPWRDGSGAAAAGPRSVLCFVSKGRAAQDMTLPSPQAETEPGGFFLTGSTVAVGQCGVTLGWEPILFPHENATGRPRKASSEHRAGTDAVMLSSSAARGHRSPSSQCWAGRYRSAVKHHDHKSQTNPPLHDAGSDGLTQSTEGSLLFYRWDISHNAAALGVRAGGDIGFPQSKLQVVLTAQGGEEQKESGRAAARLLPNVQEELREEGELHHRHGTIGGGVPKPGVRSFQANPAVSARFRFPFLLPEEGGGGGGGWSSPAVPGSLEPCAQHSLPMGVRMGLEHLCTCSTRRPRQQWGGCRLSSACCAALRELEGENKKQPCSGAPHPHGTTGLQKVRAGRAAAQPSARCHRAKGKSLSPRHTPTSGGLPLLHTGLQNQKRNQTRRHGTFTSGALFAF